MKKYIRFLSIATLVLFLSTGISAQRVDSDVFEDRTLLDGFVVGSYFSLFYSNGWSVEASPGIGYRFLNDRVIAGLGMHWMYVSEIYRFGVNINGVSYGPGQVRGQLIGPRAFVKVHPFWQVYAIGEYQFLNYSLNYKTNNDITIPLDDRQEQPLFFGAGYTSADFGKGLGFYAEIMVDVLYDNFTSVRSSPLAYRIGVFYGF